MAKCQFKSRSNSKCKDVAKCQWKSRSNSDAKMWINSKCTCVKLPLTCSETTLKLAVKRSSCDTTTAVRHPGLMADTANAVSVQRSSRQIKSKSTKDRRDCLSDRIRRRRNDDKFYGKCLTSELLKAKCRELNLQTAKCRSTMECRTPTEAQKQPNSSEANQALLLEKDSTNFLAVGYRGSDEIDHPMQKPGKEDDRRALGFKTCPMCRLAATNSSMIS